MHSSLLQLPHSLEDSSAKLQADALPAMGLMQIAGTGTVSSTIKQNESVQRSVSQHARRLLLPKFSAQTEA